jgi:glycerophosphoryl diester phosphodiesterase
MAFKCLVMLLLVTGAFAGMAAETRGPQACAHRGDTQCCPENTIPAFVSAVKKGAHQIELDVALSKDGRDVIIHDNTVDRTTNGSGKVADLTFRELRALDAGSWFSEEFAGTGIPALHEALEVIPHHILCNVHLKGPAEVGAIAARIIRDMDRQDHCFLAATVEQIEAARAAVPEIHVCNMSRQTDERETYIALTVEQNAEYIQHYGAFPGLKEAVAQSHGLGLVCNYFGASEPGPIQQCIEAGVDYILTDDLDTCLKILREACGVEPAQPPRE